MSSRSLTQSDTREKAAEAKKKKRSSWSSLKKVASYKEQIFAWSFNWKSLGVGLQEKIVDKLVFRVLYVVEAIVLVSTLCFFYLCCGCHF